MVARFEIFHGRDDARERAAALPIALVVNDEKDPAAWPVVTATDPFGETPIQPFVLASDATTDIHSRTMNPSASS